MEDRVAITLADGVAEVRLARAAKMNAIDAPMFAQIADTIAALATRAEVRVVILSGEGNAFCAGLDMAAMAGGGSGLLTEERTHGAANLVQQAAWGWRTLPIPVIAAVHGVAFGGGFQIMSGADIRLAHPATRFAIREMHWGLVPDMAGVALWRGMVRDDVVRELTYTAREFSAEEAQAFGFVTRLTEDPMGSARDLARVIAARSPDAVREAKGLFAVAADGDAATILRAESAAQLRLMRGANQREAVMANLEKRAARFAD
ncbi:crotonase/enoyl-CoA hydratase family protein [Sphingomonas carotinifaciens]|uniref:Crotonase/enoyl-CoA hydratase family protein n=1 Tax=Sphingomonas carotinifaciens TaxID=1166323 RepID=A0A1G7GCM3_9SPHN|nr:crotonase/enoyl-CoA hydratase family protein [Sphingomonas carotinifaciens]MBB4086461.1 enoyl-CoA hydratase/carnithine racemase [Sphingomonas carotinifaciens]MWC42813.1 crotonase/enoyl-CoA hydratase family protein [Sphingomonas carotinifaciens]SDE85908.1 Enoyl-CoA hydratase/carnithine racemase [Sphingomonas carotinifaciens]